MEINNKVTTHLTNAFFVFQVNEITQHIKTLSIEMCCMMNEKMNF